MGSVAPRSAASVELRGVSRSFGSGKTAVAALTDISLSIPPGSLAAITGPSGSGKSTLLHVIGAMQQVDAGQIVVGDVDITSLRERERVAYRRTIGFVFQRFHLLPALTALDNVIAPVLPLRTPYDKQDRARQLLASVGLETRAHSLPGELSGGEQQRVAVARALMNEPTVLLADEPTGNLDTATGGDLISLLTQLTHERATTVVIATHDLAIAERSDFTATLRDGHLTGVDARTVADA